MIYNCLLLLYIFKQYAARLKWVIIIIIIIVIIIMKMWECVESGILCLAHLKLPMFNLTLTFGTRSNLISPLDSSYRVSYWWSIHLERLASSLKLLQVI